MAPTNVMAEEEAVGLFDELNNWGRWGPDDEIGTLNYITPERRVAAARLVRSGRVLSLAQDIAFEPSSKNRSSLPAFKMLYRGSHPHGAACELTIAHHGFTITHLDALGHIYYEGKVYNGRSVEEAVQQDGMHFASIYAMRDGVVTRGVFLDVASARGVEWLRPDEAVTVQDLDAAERLGRVTVTTGDALFVRVGLGAREAVEGPEDPTKRAGFGPDCLRWLYQRQVAVYCGDCTEKIPSDYPRVRLPLHMIGMARMGLVLMDHGAMEPLAEACREEGRNEFLMTVAPLRIPKGTASAVNPLAIF